MTSRSPVPLGGRPRWQPIACAVFAPLSLLWAVSREYWRTWITTVPGRVIAGCLAANGVLSILSLGAVATISDPPANDAVGWYRDAIERVAFWNTGVIGYLPICLGTAALVVGVWLGWRTADELGTPTKPALVNGAVFAPVATAAPSYCSKPATSLTAAQRAVCDAAKSPASTSPRTATDPSNHYQVRQVVSARNEARVILGFTLTLYVALGVAIYARFRRDEGLPVFGGGGGKRTYTHIGAAAQPEPEPEPAPQPTAQADQAQWAPPAYAADEVVDYPPMPEPQPEPQRRASRADDAFEDLL